MVARHRRQASLVELVDCPLHDFLIRFDHDFRKALSNLSQIDQSAAYGLLNQLQIREFIEYLLHGSVVQSSAFIIVN